MGSELNLHTYFTPGDTIDATRVRGHQMQRDMLALSAVRRGVLNAEHHALIKKAQMEMTFSSVRRSTPSRRVSRRP